ncbi:signal recognition particle subunit SRP14 [Plasmodium ovale curtisi]|uniref:Signal recognition particle subunit SRP14 n=1 Tax=Plasmodium ovale curtisi TaxID=864141 RepID=A0A1A8WWE8_PLAOA|nr:signal recognition particle subunit SRP14 [Plasmodium ovale curtisi]
MVLLSNSAFIEELRKLCTREDENKKASVWITMKRVKRSMIKKMVPKKEGSEKRNDRRNKKMNRDDGKQNERPGEATMRSSGGQPSGGQPSGGQHKEFPNLLYDKCINVPFYHIQVEKQKSVKGPYMGNTSRGLPHRLLRKG